ncbi:MAG: hypothetical protein IOC58_04105 [Methylobacterium sp.]|nr:hypothetical protein [Methylobacterium sp.]MCA3604894.1 hypothetical protein [Methylobacterium sp.]MCA3628130.1 hypothetical protein [Methylobacterium sp.]
MPDQVHQYGPLKPRRNAIRRNLDPEESRSRTIPGGTGSRPAGLGEARSKGKSRGNRFKKGRFSPFPGASRGVRSLPALDVGLGVLIAAPHKAFGLDGRVRTDLVGLNAARLSRRD